MIKYVAILILILLIFCSTPKVFWIPYPESVPFYNSGIPSKSLLNYVNKNKIKSIDLLINGKNIKNYLVFNNDGYLISRNYFNLKKSEYIYKNGKLSEIIKPIDLFSFDNPDKIVFKYKNDRVARAFAINETDTIGRVIFNYSNDSIIVTSFYKNNTDAIQTDIYKYKKSQLISEKHIYRYHNEYDINYKYRGDSLICKIWDFKTNKQIDSLDSNGFVRNTFYYYSSDKWDLTTFKYDADNIEEFRKSNNNEELGYVKLIMHK